MSHASQPHQDQHANLAATAALTLTRRLPLKANFSAAVSRIRIVLADDHALVRDGLRRLLASQDDLIVVGEASNGIDALQLVHDVKPDILLLDQCMPELSGLEVIQELRARQSAVKTILLTAAVERADAISSIRLGARGIVLKEVETELLFKSIRRVHAGEIWIERDLIKDVVGAPAAPAAPAVTAGPPPRADFGLTVREVDVLRLVANGETNKAIAQQLVVGQDTVKHHLTSIFNKTGASNRVELTVFALHHRILG
jgi:two-component system nitrate/nitrite response regulator NarL